MFDKWQEKKPKERNQLTYEEAMETSENMREVMAQWTEMQQQVEKTKKDCVHFGRTLPPLTYYDKMKDELDSQ